MRLLIKRNRRRRSPSNGMFQIYRVRNLQLCLSILFLFSGLFLSKNGIAQKTRNGAHIKSVVTTTVKNTNKHIPVSERGIIVEAVIENGDTLVLGYLKKFVCMPPKTFKNKRQERKYNRLVYHVIKVYPYAKIAGIKLKEYNELLKNAETEKARKRLIKRCEKELEAHFGPELKKLTFTQGTILLKLIDRETGHTGYELVADLRGTFRAFFWHSLGRLFGYNLKKDYDPTGADKDIEDIVIRIENGYY